MQQRSRIWVLLGAVFGLSAVGASALASHWHADAGTLRALASAAQMNGWHALALLFCGLWPGGRWVHVAGLCFTLGILLFCGSIYATLFGYHWQAMAPYGGGVLMVGWAMLALAALARER